MNDLVADRLAGKSLQTATAANTVSGPVVGELIQRLLEDLKGLDAVVDALQDHLRPVLAPGDIALTPLPDPPQNVGEHASALMLIAARLETATERTAQLTARLEV